MLLGITTLMSYQHHIAALLSLAILCVSFMMEMYYSPYLLSIIHRLELFSLLSSIACWYFSLFMYVEDISKEFKLVVATCVLLAFAMFVVVFFGMFHEVYKKYKHAKAKGNTKGGLEELEGVTFGKGLKDDVELDTVKVLDDSTEPVRVKYATDDPAPDQDSKGAISATKTISVEHVPSVKLVPAKHPLRTSVSHSLPSNDQLRAEADVLATVVGSGHSSDVDEIIRVRPQELDSHHMVLVHENDPNAFLSGED
jgi:hypothetical protein